MHVEEEVADAERGEEAEDHGADQDQRRDHGAQQADQDQEDDDEDDRRDHHRVPAGGVADVEFDRGRAADQGCRATPVGGVADRVDQVEGLGRVRVGFERRLDQGPRRPFGDRRRDRLDAVDSGDGACARRRLRRCRGRRRRSARSCRRGSSCRAGAGLRPIRLRRGSCLRGQVGREEGEAGAEDQQDGDRARPRPAAARRRPGGRPAPRRRGWRRWRARGGGGASRTG